ncbi:MAG TPA: DUF4157 domain-containing protein [Ideonella sp.]|uniref:eCIS core domain-containing protein n=1 Tax=Ideonella sp. TaxID=1929293 RepID=UPI002B614E3E|nr:DUF4157 domain-containing protein [Ideonella sp.]HSI51429.1 DUF4157 domain-containing protein [Ideonella sp.]
MNNFQLLRRAPRARPAAPRTVGPAAPDQRAAVQEALGRPVQTQLKVGAPDGAHEREAEAVADRVMATSEPVLQRQCTQCADEKDKPEDATLQRLAQPATGAQASTVSTALAQGLASSRGGGQPLPRSERSFFEPRLGVPLDAVRVHTGPQAAAWSEQLGARAFTLGRDVYFGEGEYQPGSGRHLMAHELAHVVQQSRGTTAGKVVMREEKKPVDPPAPSPGDAMQSAVLSAARQALASHRQIKSPDDIYDIRNGTKTLRVASVLGLDLVLRMPLMGAAQMKNFTTCIEFGGQTFLDAVKSRSSGDAKAVQKRLALYSATLQMMMKDIELQQTVEALNKSMTLFVKPTADIQGRKDKAASALADLSQDPYPDETQAAQMTQKRLEISQLDAALKQYEAQTEKLQGQIDRKSQALDDLRSKEKAWIRPTLGLSEGRPKPGDFVLHGQPPKKKTYGVSKETTVALAPGGFTHIAVHDSTKVVAPGIELWKSIDGGGTTPDSRDNYVRLSDLLVFGSQPKPETDASAAKAILLGWFDSGKMVEGADSSSSPTAAP